MKQLQEVTQRDLQGCSMDELKQMADSQVERYRKVKQSIKDTDNPMYTDEVKDYEQKQARQTLDDNVKAIQEAYQDLGNHYIEELEQQAALATIKPSVQDKELVDGLLEEAKANLSMAVGDQSKQDAVSDLNDKTAYMTDTQKVALRRRLPELLGQSKKSDQKVRTVGSTLAEIKTEEEGALNMLKQDVASGIGIAYRNLRLAEESGKERRKEFAGEGDDAGSSELSTTKTDVLYKGM